MEKRFLRGTTGAVLLGAMGLGAVCWAAPAVSPAKGTKATPRQAASPAGASGSAGNAQGDAGAASARVVADRKTASTAAAAGAAESVTKPGSATVPNASAALKGADAHENLLAEIDRLPPLSGTGVDVAQRSADVRAHLDAALRFYRTATVPVQKVGEPSDVLYAEQNQSEAMQIAALAFEAAKNEAALLARIAAAAPQTPGSAAVLAKPQGSQSQAERMAAVRTQAQARLVTLQAQQAAVVEQLARARGSQRATLQQQAEQLDGGIKLQAAMVDALGRVTTFSSAQGQTGLAGDIDRLQRSAPELLSQPIKTPPPPVLQSLTAAHEAGVTTQASVLFQLLGTLHTIDQQIKAVDLLSKQEQDLRAPFIKVLRATIQQGQALTDQSVNLQATPTTDAQDLQNTRKQFDELTSTFRVLAAAALPLSQEGVLLDNARGTLTTWRATANAEYKDMLRHLLIRVVIIAVALGILALAGRLLNQAAVKYVADLRRRRQLLLIRRIVIGFLTGMVLIFGFVTQFSSLATFAGFISAGIAVGLQSILLSVAAYFFIVGRYGVRVGDRITVANVTGEVIEVGLVRFYMSELVGTGPELHSTGRVAVFANSVLFQTGTPIYKQMPGTEYAWHELIAKLNSAADAQATTAAVLEAVNKVYAGYSDVIQAQHQQVESWMGTALPAPKVESRLQLADGGLQLAVLFPVRINHAAEADQHLAEALVEAMKTEGPIKAGVSELPIIKAAVKS